MGFWGFGGGFEFVHSFGDGDERMREGLLWRQKGFGEKYTSQSYFWFPSDTFLKPIYRQIENSKILIKVIIEGLTKKHSFFSSSQTVSGLQCLFVPVSSQLENKLTMMTPTVNARAKKSFMLLSTLYLVTRVEIVYVTFYSGH